MEHSPPSEANSRSVSQEISHVYRNRMFYWKLKIHTKLGWETATEENTWESDINGTVIIKFILKV